MCMANLTGFCCKSYRLQYILGGIDYWQDATVKCARPGEVGSVTDVQSHDEVKGGRSVTGVHGSVMGYRTKV